MVFEILIKNNEFYTRISMLFENNVAVAAKRWVGLPPHCSYSNIIFENVVEPMVLATFFVDAGPGRPRRSSKQPLVSARTP